MPGIGGSWQIGCAEAARHVDHHFLMAEAAAAGLGVSMGPRIVAWDDNGDQSLVAPMGFTPDGPDPIGFETRGAARFAVQDPAAGTGRIGLAPA